jgi:hypothetical protein
MFESVAAYNMERSKDWLVEKFQNLCQSVKADDESEICSPCVTPREEKRQ